jgi:hypothetical protein
VIVSMPNSLTRPEASSDQILLISIQTHGGPGDTGLAEPLPGDGIDKAELGDQKMGHSTFPVKHNVSFRNQQLTPLEQLDQVVLCSNEFLFVD